MNTYFESRYQATLEHKKIVEHLREKVNDLHKDYSVCMRIIKKWNDAHHQDAGKVFVDVMEGHKPATNELRAEVEEINRCRSLTKDFWRVTFDYLEKAEPARKDEYRSRHERFVKAVKPIDVLPGYEDESDAVYSFPK